MLQPRGFKAGLRDARLRYGSRAYAGSGCQLWVCAPATLKNWLPRRVKRHGQILRATDTDAPIGDDGNLWIRTGTKAMRGIGTKIDLVMTLRDIERLGQFPGAGTKAPNIFDAAAFSHDRKTAPRLDRADQDEPSRGPPFTRTFSIQCTP